jgi:hypothetical protein
MDDRSLSALLALLDQPILLRLHVASLRNRKDLDESVLGFIALYDECEGDCVRIKKHMSAAKKSVLAPIQTKKSPSWNLLKYAAIIVLVGLSGVGITLLLNSNRVELSNTFNDPGLPNYMGASARIDLSEAMFHYKKGDFEKADLAIERVKRAHTTNDTVLYYSALIAFKNGEHDNAIKQFESISKSRSAFADRAVYFIGIDATAQNQLSKAIRIFKTLSTSEDEFVRAAAKSHHQQLQRYLH